MATEKDVRRIALSLPGTTESEKGFAFDVDHKGKPKGFVWAWLERVAPKKPRVPRRDVIAVRVASLAEKEMLLASDDQTFFTEPHYNGYPAVLVRLPVIELDQLEGLLVEAWRSLAPRAVVQEFDARRASRASRPASRVARPASRVARPASPATASRVARPASRVARPASRVARPASPATRPGSRAPRPASPATRPASPRPRRKPVRPAP